MNLTPQQCRAVDRIAIEQLGIPGIVLMENAGGNATDLVERWVRARVKGRPIRAAAVCGKGNNGGDGFVIARHLVNRGHEVSIDMLSEPADLTGDAATNCAIAGKMRIPSRVLRSPREIAAAARRWARCDVVIDAMFGTGLQGALRGSARMIVEKINALDGPLIVAVDIPSGLDAEWGVAGGPAVRADRTVTFLAMKSGYANRDAKPYLGGVTVVDIGAPLDLILRELGIDAEK